MITQLTRKNFVVEFNEILNMSQFEDASFDIVLCLGAFYHLQNETEREKSVLECKRAVKKGGLIVVAYLNRFSSFINNFSN